MINTLFKCMFLDKINYKIFFKLELLKDDKNEIKKTINKENNKNNKSQIIAKLKNIMDINNDNIKKVPSLNNSIKEKRKNKFQTKYKDRMYEICLLDCTFHKINITSNSSEDKYYVVPPNILSGIFNIKDESIIFNSSYTDISLMAKYIGENSESILSAEESNFASEEKKMIDKADIGGDKLKDDEYRKASPKRDSFEKAISRNQNIFNKLKTFQAIQSNNIIKKEVQNETKKEEKLEKENNKIKVEKRLSNKYIFPKGIYFARSEKKKVSITNSKELNQNRFENSKRDIIKKKTMMLKKYN